jgi:hypothetical protein
LNCLQCGRGPSGKTLLKSSITSVAPGATNRQREIVS